METAEKYMWRCIQLAQNGMNHTAPNPMVGAVIVCDGRIIGEGYHVRCGEAHAEVNAIRSVVDKESLKRSTIYVSLEPCSHYGKTPPCADLIIRMQIPRVVIGCKDPFVQVAGQGIERLRNAGCEVVVGVLEKECRQLIRHFITFNTLRRPYITLKWAESADGFIDVVRTQGKPARLSNDLTAMRVHKLRAENDAIMVGTNTAELDNPSLTVRHWWGDNPLRVVTDSELRLSGELTLFDGTVPTLVLTRCGERNHPHAEHVLWGDDETMLEHLMKELYQRKKQTLMVEGGRQLLQSFIDAGLWDEILIEKSAQSLGHGISSPQVHGENAFESECHFGHTVLHYQKVNI